MYPLICHATEVILRVIQAQLQRSLDSTLPHQQRAGSGRRARKEVGQSTDLDGHGSSPLSEQDSGILDVEDEEDDEVTPGDLLIQVAALEGLN